MKDTLAPGLVVTRTVTVDKARTIDFMGEDLRVYATPELVRDIEQTCRDFLLEHLDDGEDTVGTRVAIDHTGATLVGMDVTITATVTGVDGRGVSFEIAASDTVEPVAKGKHNRFVVDVAKTGERLAAKAAKARGG